MTAITPNNEKHSPAKTPKKGMDIGGWLIVVLIILIITGLSALLNLIGGINELMNGRSNAFIPQQYSEWKFKYATYSVIAGTGALFFVGWSLLHFFRRTKKFPAIFMSAIGYTLLVQVIDVFLLEEYATISNTSLQFIASSSSLIRIRGVWYNNGPLSKQRKAPLKNLC